MSWTFFTNHAHVLVSIANDPDLRLREVAEQVGISGWEIRKRNVIRPGHVWGHGQIIDDGTAGAEAVLHTYQLAHYNFSRRWNNAKYWANPENFDRYRW